MSAHTVSQSVHWAVCCCAWARPFLFAHARRLPLCLCVHACRCQQPRRRRTPSGSARGVRANTRLREWPAVDADGLQAAWSTTGGAATGRINSSCGCTACLSRKGEGSAAGTPCAASATSAASKWLSCCVCFYKLTNRFAVVLSWALALLLVSQAAWGAL